jgi:asparagine synthase (glutamine-hydrolysing)
MSAWQAPGHLLTNGREEPSPAERILAGDLPGSLLDRMMLADQTTYLPDDLLAKVDRASMAVSLEVRVPLLDHRLVEFSWRLPRRHKLRGRCGKWLLRQALYRHVPAGLVEREKMGFTVPVASWLRGGLREWADDLLAPAALREGGLFNAKAVSIAWQRFRAGQGQDALGLWAILMLEGWRRRWATAVAGTPSVG